MRVFNISLSISSSFHSTARNRVTSPCTQSCCCWSKIPYLISHQSSGREAELELPPNWFNTNFLGFSLGAVASLVDLPSAKPAHCLFLPIMKRTLFYSTPSHVSFSQTASHFARRMKSDHMWLLHVPYIHRINMHEVNQIKASFEFMMMSNYAIKSCGAIQLQLSSSSS